jgi:hypothetical protein
MKYFGMRLFFLTIPKPLKQYTLFKKRLSIALIRMCCVCSRGVLSRLTILAKWLRHFSDLAVGETAAPVCSLRENAEGAGMPPLLSL